MTFAPDIRACTVSDPAMPALAAALDLQIAGPLVRQQTAAELISAKLIRHKPGRRALVEYAVRNPDGSAAIWLGKVRSKGLDRRTFDLHCALRAEGFDDDSSIAAVPGPIAAIESLGMWIQEKVEGERFDDAMRDGPPEQLGLRLAAAIAALHSSAICPDRDHTALDELEILRTRLTRMLPLDVVSRVSVDHILNTCSRLLAELPPARACVHRDFYHDQILFGRGRTYLLDLDLCSVGDPALDIGNFVAHLLERAIRFQSEKIWLDSCGEALVQKYLQLNPAVSRRSVEVYTTVSLARHVQISTQFPDRRDFTPAIVRAVERRLELAGAVRGSN